TTRNTRSYAGKSAIQTQHRKEDDGEHLDTYNLRRNLCKGHGSDHSGEAECKTNGDHRSTQNGTESNTGDLLSRRRDTHGEVIGVKANEDDAEQEGGETEAQGRPGHPP